MKKVNLILFIIVLQCLQNIFAQTDTINEIKWSAGLYGGVIFPFEQDIYKTSPLTGFEISYNYSPYIAIYLSGTYDFLTYAKENDYDYYYERSIRLLETTIGSKFYLDPEHNKIYFQLGLGYYVRFEHSAYLGYENNYSYDDFGFNTGFGGDVKIYKKLGATISAKLHFVNLLNGGDHMIYWGLYSGIKYSF